MVHTGCTLRGALRPALRLSCIFRLSYVLAPTWCHSAVMKLRSCTLFSSIIALLGGSGQECSHFKRSPFPYRDKFLRAPEVTLTIVWSSQGNYSAANMCLDSLASLRRNQCLPSVSVQWGPWGHIGMASQGAAKRRFDASGFKLIDPIHGLRLLSQVTVIICNELILLNIYSVLYSWSISLAQLIHASILPVFAYAPVDWGKVTKTANTSQVLSNVITGCMPSYL